MPLKGELYQEINSNFSRFTPNLIRIYEDIKNNINSNNEVYFLSQKFKNDLSFIGGLNVKLTTDFLLKLEMFSKNKHTIIRIIIDFFNVNIFKLNYFYLILNCIILFL